MKICHVITRLIIGGAQENTVLSCRGLAERGHDVTLVAGPETGPEGSLWEQTKHGGFVTVKLDDLRRAVQPIRDWRAYRSLKRLFERDRPDVVHTHSSKAGILARAAAAAAGVPVIVHTIHGMSFNRTQGSAAYHLYRWLERRAARNTTAFISVADAMTDQAVEAGLAPREKFHTVRSGMETDRFNPDASVRAIVRREWAVNDDEVVIGTVARLFANKGYEEIIEAMPAAVRDHPRLRFVWIGDGAHRTHYERRLSALDLAERVRFVGLVPPSDIPRLLNGFDILLHASRWEGLPRAVVQGLLTEVPAISFDNDGAPEVVDPGETGMLLPFGDIEGLAEAVALLADDPETRLRMGCEGRSRCLREFDWRLMVDRLEALYGSLQARP